MQFDLALPSVVFLIVAISVVLYRKVEKSFAPLFEDRKFSTSDAILMVVLMGFMVVAIVVLPSQAVQIGFIGLYSYMLLVFTYMALKKWYLAVVPPIVFLVSYVYFWQLAVFNIFVTVFAVIITVFMSAFFTWKTVWAFAAILTVMDVFHVYVTGFMEQAAIEMIALKLPVMLMLPGFPFGNLIGLGMGDLFIAGLLAIQTAKKLGQNAGILVAAMIGIAMFIFEVVLFNTGFAEFFPATVVVVAGWLASLGVLRLASFRQKPST
jgi:hypothetical protein